MKNRTKLAVTTLTAIVCLYSWACTTATEPTRQPNIIVIFCDNLGYGDIEPFGSTLHRTPHLNRMAKEGRKFTHFCVSAGVCTPSRASLMTGCYAQRVGMHNNPRDGQVLRPVSPYGLHPNEITIAEVLQAAGYKTGIIGKWHLGDQPEFLPTRQGFDLFFGVPYSDDMTAAVGQRVAQRGNKQLQGHLWPPLPLMKNETVIEAPVERTLLTQRYTKQATQFIENTPDHPFFLSMPQALPGSTSTAFSSPAFKGKSKNGSWGDSIEELDWSTGQILDKLTALGLEKETLVIWTSDNGAPMNNDPNDPTRGTNLPLNGRGYTTSEGAFRVPTIMWWPSVIPAATVCDELSTTMDLLPTFAKLSGGNIPQNRIIDGHDIRSLIFAEPNAKTPYRAFYYYAMNQLQAVRSGPWKLFVPLEKFNRHPHFKKGEIATTLLFNVVTDIGSKQNVATQHPEIVKQLSELANRVRQDLGDEGLAGSGQRLAGKTLHPQPQLLQPKNGVPQN
ncbi:MAG TPA: arylsulfatase [Planctomycetaceae bacterium]|nr:arylsulfatase [Planctomycetaceae bacterium]